ncbi:MAG: hypothetical protein M3680_24070, partial [Myxococcota bacterium]|nr:hypothetical protein [Myxococcota bacterium]
EDNRQPAEIPDAPRKLHLQSISGKPRNPAGSDQLASAVMNSGALLAAGGDPDAEGTDKRTAWMFAMSAKDHALLELLFEHVRTLEPDREETTVVLREVTPHVGSVRRFPEQAG